MIDRKPQQHHQLSLLAISLWPSLKLLRNNDPLRMAGATSFFTTFALPPIVFILARLFGLFLTPKVVGRGLIEHLGNNLGDAGAEQVRQVIRSIRGFGDSWYITVFGFIFLLFVATTLFIVVKNSLNQIWEIHIKEMPGFMFNLIGRLKSFAIILVVGLLFCADLFLKSLETIGGNYIQDIFGGGGAYFTSTLSELSGIVIVAVWFIMLFRFLGDARPKWRAAVAGGLLTGILFTIGRFILRILLVKGNIGVLYGPSGALVLVLLFVFYTSFILYYGAGFIKVYSEKNGWELHPDAAVEEVPA